jgi:hypothetical protein
VKLSPYNALARAEFVCVCYGYILKNNLGLPPSCIFAPPGPGNVSSGLMTREAKKNAQKMAGSVFLTNCENTASSQKRTF